MMNRTRPSGILSESKDLLKYNCTGVDFPLVSNELEDFPPRPWSEIKWFIRGTEEKCEVEIRYH